MENKTSKGENAKEQKHIITAGWGGEVTSIELAQILSVSPTRKLPSHPIFPL